MKISDFKPWDKAMHGGELLTFDYIDGMYATWFTEKWERRIGHSAEYELKDGIYYPI